MRNCAPDVNRPLHASQVSELEELTKFQLQPQFVLFEQLITSDDGPLLRPVFFFTVEALQEWIVDRQRYSSYTQFKVYELSGAQVTVRTVVEVKT